MVDDDRWGREKTVGFRNGQCFVYVVLDHGDVRVLFYELAHTATRVRAARAVMGDEELDHMLHAYRVAHE